jgi:hypothetical protein
VLAGDGPCCWFLRTLGDAPRSRTPNGQCSVGQSRTLVISPAIRVHLSSIRINAGILAFAISTHSQVLAHTGTHTARCAAHRGADRAPDSAG